MNERRVAVLRSAVVLTAAAILLYGAALAYLVTQETRLVFRAGRPLGPERPTFPYEQVDCRAPTARGSLRG